MQDDTTIGKAFYMFTCIVLPLIIMVYCVYYIAMSRSIYALTPIPFTSFTVHSISMIILSLSYLLHQNRLAYLYPIPRFTINLMISVWYIYFGGCMWSLNSAIFRSVNAYLIAYNIAGLVLVSMLLLRFGNAYSIFKLDIETKDVFLAFSLFVAQIFCYFGLAFTGFWKSMTLSDLGLFSDPNVNIFWLIMRITAFWYIYPLLFSFKEHRAPYKLTGVTL